MNDLNLLTATQLAASICEGQISVTEVIDAYLTQIARHNPNLNAIVTLDEENARRRAVEADEALAQGTVWGPLHGVPFTVKDAFETAGLRTTSHHKPLADYVPTEDATVVARLKAAGAILLGKTNLAELAGDIQTGGPLFGRANNPWNVEYTTGGSSGGSAAAVAAGLSALDIGSDLGGSIRIPAHYCGVFGLKPTEYLVSGAGHIPNIPGKPAALRHMNTFGPFARSVEDLRLCLRLITGADGRDLRVPPLELVEPEPRPLERLRFAWTDNFGDVPVAAEVKKAVESLAVHLEEMGCQVEYANPANFNFDEAWHTYGEIFGPEGSWNFPPLIRIVGAWAGSLINKADPVVSSASRGLRRNMRRYMEALTRRDRLIQTMEAFLNEWDAWLCPVSSTTAFTHRRLAIEGPPQMIEVDEYTVPYMFAGVAYTSIFNLTGNPVVVIPLTKSSAGLPIGVQVVGKRWRDMELLAIVQQMVKVTSGFVPPPLS